MNKNRVTPTIVGDDSASKRKVFFANFDNAGHQGGNATNFARTETGADCFDASGSAAASMTSQCSQSGLAACHNTRGASRNKKFIKIFAASGLAIMMGIGTLCGVLIAPMNSAQATMSGDATAQTLSAQEEAKAELDANIVAGGGLGLDPENDPVVWVTDNGFEIKSHDVSVSSDTTTVSTVSYKYVTLGSYNWIIIGYSTNAATQGTGHVSVATPDNYERNTYSTWLDGALPKFTPDTTDAGTAIKSAVQTQSTNFYNPSSFTYKLKTIFTNAVGANEIPAGCVLCFCETYIGSSKFSDNYSSYYPNSTLDTAMTTAYNSISSAAGGAIQSTSLTTYWYNGSSATKYTHSEYLFPLAGKTYWNSASYPQNYCVETYLNSNAKRDIDTLWWLRSGYVEGAGAVYCVDDNGGLTNNAGSGQGARSASKSLTVRPAFVLKLA